MVRMEVAQHSNVILVRNSWMLKALCAGAVTQQSSHVFRTVDGSFALTASNAAGRLCKCWLMVWPSGKSLRVQCFSHQEKAINITLILDLVSGTPNSVTRGCGTW